MAGSSIDSRIMVVAAHPDDAEFGCGGTVAKWIEQGAQAVFVIATNGDKGDDRGVLGRNELAEVRKHEQLQAANLMGVKHVEFLDCEDSSLQADAVLRGRIVELIRKWKPDTVFTHDPSVVFARSCGVNHCDHRNLGLVTVDAIYPYARGVHQYPEHKQKGLDPHTVDRILVWDSETPDFWEDVTDSLHFKIDALLAHKSQYDQPDKLRDFIEANLTIFGEGNKRQFAESFRRILFS